jgi:hypothetical protein
VKHPRRHTCRPAAHIPRRRVFVGPNEWLDKMQTCRTSLGERASVLWRLARRSVQAQRLPLRVTSATLWLGNGQNAHNVVLHVDDSQHLVSIASNDGTLTLLPLNSIVGISVHDMDAWQRPPGDVEGVQRAL